MPVVFRQDGFRFLFYANEGSPREPMHVHALRDGVDAKFWLWPEVKPAYNDGFNARVLRDLTGVKSVFRPGRFHHAGPHFPATDAAQSTVFRTAEGGLHKPGWDGAAPTMSEAPCADTAWVSHYFFRSAEEYLSKFSRTRGDAPYQAGRVEVPAGFVDAFVDQAATAGQVLDERTLQCAPGAAAFKAGLLAIPTVANAARLVARRFAETRAASLSVIEGLAAAAPDDSQRRFYRMVRDSVQV